MRRLLLLLSCMAPLMLLAAGPAGADVFEPISLVSEGSLGGGQAQQADYVHDPVISGDGRYVAFDGSFGGVTGVWRRDLQSGVVERVDAEQQCPNLPSPCYAELPSISNDGRYVSFTTTVQLAPGDKNRGPDVYVRDMTRAPGEAGAFTLASAADGSEDGLQYEAPGTNTLSEFEETHYGSVASGRSALSANGREVVFVTTAVSNLADAGTPALQVAVRNLDADSTELVSVAYDPATGKPAIDPTTHRQEPVSSEEGGQTYGAVYSPNPSSAAFKAPATYSLQSPVGASISADGSTVSWMGQDISRQAPVLSGEAPPAPYSEPLWRRIADGAETPTRRITGGSDPANPACAASAETALPEVFSSSDPCQGPFRTEALGIWIGGTGDPVPQLSADGSTVAFLAGAPSINGTFGGDVLNNNSDLYVVNMREGLNRREALSPLTELASGNPQEPATTAPIVDLAISPDASQVAFTTQRTVLPLGSPAYISVPATVPGMAELFDADLADGTLTRVTHGFAGGAGEAAHGTEVSGQDPYTSSDGALSPSFSANGKTLAFSSTAANLVFGDGNTPSQTNNPTFDGSDAFIVSRVLFGATPTSQYVSTVPGPSFTPVWNLGVTALSRPDGSVLLYVQVPGAGKLRASSSGVVLISSERSSRAARHSRTSASRRRRGRARTATRTVALAGAYPASEGLLALPLKLAKPYTSLASARGGLSASVAITFTAPGRPTLHKSVSVTFRRKVKPARSKARSRKAGEGR